MGIWTLKCKQDLHKQNNGGGMAPEIHAFFNGIILKGYMLIRCIASVGNDK